MVVPPQHCLYFFPEPHGLGEFLPTLGTLCRGSLVWALGLTCRCDRKILISARKPSRHVHDDFFELSGLIGLGRISGSSSCSWQSIIVRIRSVALLIVDKLSPAVVARTVPRMKPRAQSLPCAMPFSSSKEEWLAADDLLIRLCLFLLIADDVVRLVRCRCDCGGAKKTENGFARYCGFHEMPWPDRRWTKRVKVRQT